MDDRAAARTLAQKHVASGDPLGWFEPLYAAASGDASAIPWADLRPNANLLAWLDAAPTLTGRRALVVGCGLGDDAQELARRGFEVTAFDVAPTAIEWCRRRFAGSRVTYEVADVLRAPPAWAGAFDLVVEAYTLQVLPAGLRAGAMRAMAEFLAPAGALLVICRGREPGEPEGEMPWPLTRLELTELAAETGLAARAFEDYFDDERPPVWRFRGVYQGTAS